MKPHEETWRAIGDTVFTDDGKDKGYIRAAAYFGGNGNATAPVAARFIAAAPEMARALVSTLRPARMHSARETGSLHTPECLTSAAPCIAECSAIRSALIKGGVPL